MIVMIDAAWEGSPGAARIRERITEHLEYRGWGVDRGLALVLVPEVDVWLWTQTDHTARVLGWPSWLKLQQSMERTQWCQEGLTKPVRPKEAAEWALSVVRKPRSSKVYEDLGRSVGLQRCTDAAFVLLQQTLTAWFPSEES